MRFVPLNLTRKLAGYSLAAQEKFQFVPKHSPPTSSDVNLLKQFHDDHNKIFVLTGAGISTESGIPDYRSEGVGLYNRTNHRPMFIQEFLKSEEARRRYWARNYVGWTTFSQSEPNETHRILRKWEKAGKVDVVVTQNVDRLHHKAGTKAIELHGTGYEVICLNCPDFREDRHVFQKRLIAANPNFRPDRSRSEVRPDGDIDLDPEEVKGFRVPACPLCSSGILKPDIIFFGDNVPKGRVEEIYRIENSCDSMLVLGSTLQVFSSFRFVLKAKELGIPIGIITLGTTRADDLATFKLNLRVGEILSLVDKEIIE